MSQPAEEPRPMVCRCTLTSACGVAALAVHQHQHLVRAERRAAVAGRMPLGAVGQCRAREVQRGQGARQRGGQLGGAGGLQGLGGDDVDRDCDSATVRSATRVPVTITVSRVLAVARAGASWAAAANAEAPRTTATAAASVVVLRFIRMWLRLGRGGTEATSRLR
jgi:hypothetical protein